MPNRELREAIRFSEKAHALSPEAFRLFVLLLTCADDYGRFHADPRLVRSACFPLSDVRLSDVGQWLDALTAKGPGAKDGMVVMYEAEGKQYLVVNQWRQRTRANGSKFPEPPPSLSCARPVPGLCPASDRRPPSYNEERGSNNGGEDSAGARGRAPQKPAATAGAVAQAKKEPTQPPDLTTMAGRVAYVRTSHEAWARIPDMAIENMLRPFFEEKGLEKDLVEAVRAFTRDWAGNSFSFTVTPQKEFLKYLRKAPKRRLSQQEVHEKEREEALEAVAYSLFVVEQWRGRENPMYDADVEVPKILEKARSEHGEAFAKEAETRAAKLLQEASDAGGKERVA